MSLFNRLGTLLRADAHGVVDAVEDRSLLLRQHVREAEAELGRKRARVEALAAEERDLGDERRRVAERREALDKDVQLALAEAKEDLARFSIKRLLPLDRALVELARRAEAAARERGELSATLAEQEQELENLRARAKAHLARAASGVDGHAGAWAEPVADEEVELELLRRKQTVQGGAA